MFYYKPKPTKKTTTKTNCKNTEKTVKDFIDKQFKRNKIVSKN